MKVLAFAVLATLAASSAPAQSRQDRGQFDGPGRMEGRREMFGRPGMMRDPDRMFAMMDANHDGRVTRQEFGAFHQRIRAMRERRMERRAERFGDDRPEFRR